MPIIERIAAHYDVQEVGEFGRTYRWCPDSVMVECECGKRSTHKRLELLSSLSICECGADYTAGIRGELAVQLLDEDETARHPWRYWRSSGDTGIPC